MSRNVLTEVRLSRIDGSHAKTLAVCGTAREACDLARSVAFDLNAHGISGKVEASAVDGGRDYFSYTHLPRSVERVSLH